MTVNDELEQFEEQRLALWRERLAYHLAHGQDEFMADGMAWDDVADQLPYNKWVSYEI